MPTDKSKIYRSDQLSPSRLKKEYEQIIKAPPTGTRVYLPSESDLYTWESAVEGPAKSLYEGM